MDMSRILMSSMAAMIGLALVSSAVQAYTPKQDYICPICGMRFATYDELYSHFTSEHQAEPIEIIWE